MTFGAMIGWLTVYEGGSLWLGMLAAIAGGAALGLLHRLLVVSLGLSQHVTGARHNPLCVQLHLLRVSTRDPGLRKPAHDRPIPAAGHPRSVEPSVSGRGLILAGSSDLSCGRSRPTAGLCARPHAAWTRHPSRRRESTRRGGAEYQSDRPAACRRRGWQRIDECRGLIPYYNCFQQLLSHYGSGTRLGLHHACCLCIVRPGRALGGALLFAFCDAFQLRLQHVIGKAVPYQLLLMMPYLVSILALLLVARRARVPQALMVPYRRGER
jgi:hypothetical protein